MAAAYKIERCTAEDMEECAMVMTLAFDTDAIMQYMHVETPREITISNNIDGFKKAFTKPGRVYEKVVEVETGKIIAFSRWYFPYQFSDEQIARDEDKDLYNWEEPEGSNVPLCKEFFEQLFGGRNTYVKRDSMYFLNILAVHPDYQRKGLGGMLLERVTPIADKEKKQIYLEASKKGHDLYLKHGWKKIDGMSIDTRPHGGHSVERLEFFMRDPQPVKES